MIQQITIKKLMKDSLCFKILCLVFVVLIAGGIIQAIMFSTNDCGYSSYYYNACYDFYSSRQYECSIGNIKYCCSSSYSTCGDSYCSTKPYDYRTYRYYYPCYGQFAAMWSFFGLSVAVGIAIIVKIFNFKAQAASQNLIQALYIRNANLAQQHPIIYAQNQQAGNQKEVYQNQVNNSEQNWIEEPMLR